MGLKDAAFKLRSSYFTLLNGVISVPIYDGAAVPSNAPVSYVVFGGFTSEDRPDKTSFAVEATQTLIVVTRFTGEGSTKTSDDIAAEIIDIIRARPLTLDLTPDFDILTATLDNSSTTIETTEDGKAVNRSIRFRHIICE